VVLKIYAWMDVKNNYLMDVLKTYFSWSNLYLEDYTWSSEFSRKREEYKLP
jgi:hypothetical protein